MGNFWTMVNQVIGDADVLLMVLDARLVQETRNSEIEYKVKQANKPLIYVVTKSDLVEREEAEKWKNTLKPCVFISSTKHLGTTRLRERILIEAKRAYPDKYSVWVGVLGYPNVGKSSLINALKGKKSAPTSITSGYTKGIQKIRADNRIMLLDTPGVIPYAEKSTNHALTGTIDFNKVRDPDLAAMDLMTKFPGRVERFYGVKVNKDLEETIEAIAVKNNILIRGGTPDALRMARMILKDWQKGLID